MKRIANMTRGKYYYLEKASDLPKIFVKEAQRVARSLIVNQTFTPAVAARSPVLTGFDSLPTLTGYVLTEPKARADVPVLSPEGAPVLAHWQYGLGRSLAFTSDVRPKWAANWIPWPRFDEFWAQQVRYVLRQTSNRNIQISTTTEGKVGRIVVDAIGDDGSFMNFLAFNGNVLDPDLEGEEFAMRQVSPGRYVGAAQLEDDGIPFEAKMTKMSQTLYAQMEESAKLDDVIRKNLEGLGYAE